MKIFKLISGILILFVILTGIIVLFAMGAVPTPTFLNALIVAAKLYGFLAICTGIIWLGYFGIHLIISALKNDEENK